MIEFDDRFSFNFISHIPIGADVFRPELALSLDPFRDATDEDTDSAYEITLPIAVSTGFFEKTKFKALAIFLLLVDSDKAAQQIEYVERKRERRLWVNKTHHLEELQTQLRTRCAEFLVESIVELLAGLCKKYDLDDHQIVAYLKEHSASMPAFDALKVPTVSTDENEELVIYIKSSNDDSLLADELIANTQIMESIDYWLKQKGLGRVTASEHGGGYESVVCEGPSAQAMHEALIDHLKNLPSESYAEITADGEITQIKIVRDPV
jgi:hypothetical protein